MNEVNKTCYIPLYGKAYVSKKSIILKDTKAEEIWDKEGFELKGKSKSKWLCYFMGMRSAVFDQWVSSQINEKSEAVVFHLGCGLDSRVLRVNHKKGIWYDIDFDDVIQERKKYYQENDHYKMISCDLREDTWLDNIPAYSDVIIVMEGISMYFEPAELNQLLINLRKHFDNINLLMDCYSVKAAKLSKYKNPINDVGVTQVYGLDDPMQIVNATDYTFVRRHEMTPEKMINELKGYEHTIFKMIYAGSLSKDLYRIYEFKQ